MLHGYDPNILHYLLHGFGSGFSVGCIGLPPQFNKAGVTNLKSASEFPEVFDRKLSKGLRLGRMRGPFAVPPPYCNYRVSPLGVFAKKAAGEFQMIHHLSYPDGSSVNYFIPHEFSSVRYPSIFEAIDFIKHSPHLVYMAKVDIESAISPTDRLFPGFRWKGQFFMDTMLPMGCSSSCAIFKCFSTALV